MLEKINHLTQILTSKRTQLDQLSSTMSSLVQHQNVLNRQSSELSVNVQKIRDILSVWGSTQRLWIELNSVQRKLSEILAKTKTALNYLMNSSKCHRLSNRWYKNVCVIFACHNFFCQSENIEKYTIKIILSFIH